MAKIPPKLSGLVKSGAVVAAVPVHDLPDLPAARTGEKSSALMNGRSIFHTPEAGQAGLAVPDGHLIRHVAVELIDPNPLAPRAVYTAEMIRARADDLKAQGQHDPIHLTPNPEKPGRFIICDGWTRVQACRVHGVLKTLRAEIHDGLSDVDSAIFGYQQNEGRKQHTDYDRAMFFEKLKSTGLSAVQISSLTGIPENRLSMYKSLATLPACVVRQLEKAPELFGYNAGAQLSRLCPAQAPESDPGIVCAVRLAEQFATGEKTFKWLKSQVDAHATPKPRKPRIAGANFRYSEGYLRGHDDTVKLELKMSTPDRQAGLLEALRAFLRNQGIVESNSSGESEPSEGGGLEMQD